MNALLGPGTPRHPARTTRNWVVVVRWLDAWRDALITPVADLGLKLGRFLDAEARDLAARPRPSMSPCATIPVAQPVAT